MGYLQILSILLILIFPLLEIIFASSSFPILVNLRLIYMLGFLFIGSKKTKVAIFFVIVASTIVEFVNLQPVIGLSAISFFIGILFASLLSRLSSFFSRDDNQLLIFISFVLALFIKHGLLRAFDLDSAQVAFPVLIFNAFVFVIFIYIASRFTQTKNVFKRK